MTDDESQEEGNYDQIKCVVVSIFCRNNGSKHHHHEF